MIVRIQGEKEAQNHIYYEYDSESAPLGEGGMGIVYQGYCINALSPDEFIPVAIKSIQNPTQNLIDRAMREASIQIDHPNLLRMYGFIPNMEIDEYSQSYRPKYYIVMERIVGVSLENLINGVLIDKSGTYVDFAKELYDEYINDRPTFVRRITSAVCDGLDALHKFGYVHRDVDPSNIMVTHDGHIKLIDYGVSKTIQTYNNGPKLTQAGSIIGKPSYAAPEIISGDVSNHNQTTDIYAVGILIYQMYVGVLPFQGDTGQIMYSQVNEQVPVKNIDNQVIRSVVAKATSKLQSERYQDAKALSADIMRADKVKKKESRKKAVSEVNISFEVKTWMWAASAIAGLVLGVVMSFVI